MTELSDKEIAEAAAEAGITPAQLRAAMAEQAENGALATFGSGGSGGGSGGAGAAGALRRPGSTLPPSTRGVSVANTETSLPYPPEQAVRSVKRQIERELGSTGHMMGSTEADIYDEAGGVIYRIQAESDGGGGSMVRVDIDPTPLRSRRTLTGMGLGATVGLFAISGLVIPGLIGWALIAGAVGLTALGSTSMLALRKRAIQDARALTANALIEAEQGADIGGTPQLEGPLDAVYGDHQRALPPGEY